MKRVQIQKYADGGIVEDLDSLEKGYNKRQYKKAIDESTAAYLEPETNALSGAGKVERPFEMPIENVKLKTEPASQMPQADLMQPQQPAMPLGVQQQIQGINQTAQAQADFGNQEAELLQQKQMQMQEIADRQLQLHDEYRNEIRNITADIQNGMIDPNRYVNSMTTTGKVGTAIGLLIGGFGAGIAGQENLALKYLNTQIDNDVKAQMANQQSKQNLYSYAMQNFKNENDAMAATKAMYADMYASKIEQAAAKLKDPVAKANALMQAGKLREPYDAQLAQVAQRQALMQAAGSPNALPATKDRAINQLISTQPEARQKELLEAKEVYDSTKEALGVMDDVFKEIKQVGVQGLNPLSKSSTKVDAARAKVESALRATMKGQGTIQESEIKRLVEPFQPGVMKTDAQLDQALEDVKELLISKNMGQIKRLSNAGIPIDDIKPKKKTDIKK